MFFKWFCEEGLDTEPVDGPLIKANPTSILWHVERWGLSVFQREVLQFWIIEQHSVLDCAALELVCNIAYVYMS
jgi:hypothetical protein